MKKYNRSISEQRYAIYLGPEDGTSKKDIALPIRVHISTPYGESKRNKNKRGGYSWPLAHEMAEERKERLPGRRSIPEWIKQKVLGSIWEDWSSKQISGYLKKLENIAVSHEIGYMWIREDKEADGGLYKLKHRKRSIGCVKDIPNRRSIR